MPELKIKNHRFVEAPFHKARWTGGKIDPIAVIVHDTAGRLTPRNSAAYLQNNAAQTSVHLVVERDGGAEQQVPFDRRANHAGRSSYRGRVGCNNFTIGIEIVNPGCMTAGRPGFARAWYGQEFDIEEYGIQYVETKEHGSGWWMPYPEEQLQTVEDMLGALLGKYPAIRDIVGHWYVSPGRKFDTNPLFPLAQIRSRVMGREDFAEDDAEAGSVAMPATRDTMMMVNVPGDSLNMRRWPSFNPNVIHAVPHGTLVPVIRAGKFADRDWALISYGGREGWVVDRYLSTPTR